MTANNNTELAKCSIGVLINVTKMILHEDHVYLRLRK